VDSAAAVFYSVVAVAVFCSVVGVYTPLSVSLLSEQEVDEGFVQPSQV
jgi:hypothetical protein